jgi:hypothetical protein
MKKKVAMILAVLFVLSATNAFAWGSLVGSVVEPPSTPKPPNPPVKGKTFCGDNC